MNIYFICVIVHVWMWHVCTQPYVDQTKNIFDHFICISKCLLRIVFKFCTYFVFQYSKLVFVLKIEVKVFRELFATWLQVTKLKNAFLAIFGHQAVAFPSHSWVGQLQNAQISIYMGITWVFGSKLFLWLHLLQTFFFNASASKPNQFQSFYIPLTFLR